MAVFDREQQKIVLRVVYDGPARAGKTTNVQQLCSFFTLRRRSELYVPEEMAGRTLFFDWMHLDGGLVAGYSLRCQIVTCPGQRQLAARRKQILQTADVVVFVCSSTARSQARARSALETLRWSLRSAGREDVPIIVQANKQDLKTAIGIDEIRERLQLEPEVEIVGARAKEGVGVRETSVLAIRAGAARVGKELMEVGLDAIAGNVEGADDLLERLREQDGSAMASRGTVAELFGEDDEGFEDEEEAAEEREAERAAQAVVAAAAAVLAPFNITPGQAPAPAAPASEAPSEARAPAGEAQGEAPAPAVPAGEAQGEAPASSDAKPGALAPTPAADAAPDATSAPAAVSSAGSKASEAPASEAPASEAPASEAPRVVAKDAAASAAQVGQAVEVGSAGTPSKPQAVPLPRQPEPSSPKALANAPVASAPASALQVAKALLPSWLRGPKPAPQSSPIAGPPQSEPEVGGGPAQSAPQTEPPHPDEKVPTGCVWPSTTGRQVLRLLRREQWLRRTDLAGQRGIFDGSGSADTLIYQVGPWCAKTSPRRRYENADEGRDALLQVARRKILLGELLPPRSVVSLQQDSQGRAWVWTVAPWLRTLRKEMSEAVEQGRERSLSGALENFARAAGQSALLATRNGVLLDVHPSNFASVDRRLFYLDDDIDSSHQLPGLGHALLQRIEEYSDWPEVIESYVAAVIRELCGVLQPPEVRSLGMLESLDQAQPRHPLAIKARSTIVEAMTLHARGKAS